MCPLGNDPSPADREATAQPTPLVPAPVTPPQIQKLELPSPPERPGALKLVDQIARSYFDTGKLSIVDISALQRASADAPLDPVFRLASALAGAIRDGHNPFDGTGTAAEGIANLTGILSRFGADGAARIWDMCRSPELSLSIQSRGFFDQELSKHPATEALLIEKLQTSPNPNERQLALSSLLHSHRWEHNPRIYSAVLDAALTGSTAADQSAFDSVTAKISPHRYMALLERSDFDETKPRLSGILRQVTKFDAWKLGEGPENGLSIDGSRSPHIDALIESAAGSDASLARRSLELLGEVGAESHFSNRIGSALCAIRSQASHSLSVTHTLNETINRIYYGDADGFASDIWDTSIVLSTAGLVAAGAAYVGASTVASFAMLAGAAGAVMTGYSWFKKLERAERVIQGERPVSTHNGQKG